MAAPDHGDDINSSDVEVPERVVSRRFANAGKDSIDDLVANALQVRLDSKKECK